MTGKPSGGGENDAPVLLLHERARGACIFSKKKPHMLTRAPQPGKHQIPSFAP